MAAIVAAAAAHARISTPPILSSDMVLQQGRPVPVWGKAAPGERITVTFGKQKTSTRAAADSSWLVTLKPMAASATPRTLTIKGRRETIEYTNVVVGEVWIAAGQSNMQYSMRRHKAFVPPAHGVDSAIVEMQKPANAMLRVYVSARKGQRPWAPASGESLPDVAVLCELAKMYGVTLDYLVSGHGEKRPAPAAGKRRRRLLVTAMSCLLVWFLATLVFSFLYFFGADLPRRWLSFVWAMPVSGIVLVVFAALWGNRVLRTLAVSFLIWTVALAIYLTFAFPYSWLLFVVAVPLQVLAVFWFLLRVPRAKK